MDLDGIMLSEMSHTDKYHMILLNVDYKQNKMNKQKRKRPKDIENKLIIAKGRWE